MDPAELPSGRDYLEMVAQQRAMRETPLKGKEVFLTIANVGSDLCASYEPTLLDDLFDMRHELIEFLPDGEIRSYGYLEQHGLHEQPSGDYIDRKQNVSYKLPLSALLGPGRHELAIRNWHQGELFYSWIVAVLENDRGESFRFRFCNELEPDRAFLHFPVELQD